MISTQFFKLPNLSEFRIIFSRTFKVIFCISFFSFNSVLSQADADKDALFNKGYEEEKKGNYWAAIKLYNKVVELDSNYEDVYYRRGLSKAELNDLNGAIADFTKAIQADPNDVDALRER